MNNKMKGIIKVVVLFVVIIMSSCKSSSYQNLEEGLYADIQTDKGNILLELEYKYTPITVANFVSLAEGNNVYVSENYRGKPFYDGLKFHRVVKNFMIQGGDPKNNGRGGPGYQFENEHPMKNDSTEMFIFDKAGVLAMANGGRNTNGSQFFITHIEYPSLNGNYTIFGQVVTRQEVVDSIVKDDVMNTIKIIRVGKEAKKFKAAQIFGNYFKKLEEEAKIKLEKLQKAKQEFLKKVVENKTKAKEFPSGLKMFITEEGSGVKPKRGVKVRINYAVFFTEGSLIATSYKDKAEKFNKFDQRIENTGTYNPFSMIYNETATLVPGFREAMLNMNYGDKAMLFVPAHLAYGSQGKSGIPPNTDLIFEMEIVDESDDLD